MNSKREHKHGGGVSARPSKRITQKPRTVRDLAAGEARDNRVVGGTAGSFKFFMNVEALP